MASTCDKCGNRVGKIRLVGGRWLGHECGCVVEVTMGSTVNPYGDLTLHHVHDEFGKPVHVSSARQLRAAEQRYQFCSVVANSEERNFNAPPSAPRQHIDQHYQRKFARG